MKTASEPRPPYILTDCASRGLGIATVGATGFFAAFHVAIASWIHRVLWGMPGPIVYGCVIAILLLLALESTRRTVLSVDRSRRRIRFTKFAFWWIRIGTEEARYAQIRYIDIHHTAGLSAMHDAPVSEFLSRGGTLPFRLAINGLSPAAWFLDWLFSTAPPMGAAQLKVRLNEGTEWVCIKRASEEHVIRHAEELKELTGARIT